MKLSTNSFYRKGNGSSLGLWHFNLRLLYRAPSEKAVIDFWEASRLLQAATLFWLSSCSFGYALDSQSTNSAILEKDIDSSIFSPELPCYENFDVFGSYAVVNNIEGNDFCEKSTSFEDKLRDVVAPVHRHQ